MEEQLDAVDLFAGPGGWDVAAKRLGLNVLGFEFDHAACETRRAAGHATIEGDVRDYGPEDFPSARGLIASPPCPTFSMAGKGSGRRALDDVLAGIAKLDVGGVPPSFDDERTGLVLEPLRWVLEAIWQGLEYDWLAFEQVPPVLPIWEAMAVVLRRRGYSVATGILNAEQYGVPQTRRRAILVASRNVEVSLPTPTHSRYYSRNPAKLDEGVLPWVSMAEALGWGMTARPSMTVCGGGTSTGGAEPFGNGARKSVVREAEAGRWALRGNQKPGGRASYQERSAEHPPPTVTTMAGRNQWVLQQSAQKNATVQGADEPAPTITGGHDHGERRWVLRNNSSANAAEREINRPATTAAGDPRIGQPGHKCMTDDCHPERGKTAQFDSQSIRVTQAETATLQTFPADYPWWGNKGQQFQQIGNAVPPLLAEAVLRVVQP